MKAKIGNIEIEGTPEEIKEFISQQDKTTERRIVSSSHSTSQSLDNHESGVDKTADNIHTQIADEVNKDYNDDCDKHSHDKFGRCLLNKESRLNKFAKPKSMGVLSVKSEQKEKPC